ncbi:uncharacterized protein B0H64DRAFT_438234 [Chaetomium fimeti]|uniref:GH16 domain-containing protein n=1 Tax=Chaetomium fimeti TaxID=1854472 RepID=A0AAE0LXF1_9PEZI|nr:hypothetical protein B0H64DRAFT_438234 [Chaetomium fimeti]
MVRPTLGFASLALTASSVWAASYNIVDTFDASNFFSEFDFFTAPDPTHGFVKYVDSATASRDGLAGYADGGVYLGVDYTNTTTTGRPSVRVTSKKAYTKGLFIADIAHMPAGAAGSSSCGIWPAFWMFGPNWPNSGEIDIIEGVNSQRSNAVTLHTGPGCAVTNAGSLAGTKLVSTDCEGNAGCSQSTGAADNYGAGFNAAGGGIYALEWTDAAIKVWFFPRGSPTAAALALPSSSPQQQQPNPNPNTNSSSSSSSSSPDPSTFGTPLAVFAGCPLADHFADHNLVFDTTFCGDWAGRVWDTDSACAALAPTCEEFVGGNPEVFAQAFCDPPGSPRIPSFPDGVKVLHDCPDAVVDICFVHGLTGDRESTWTAHGHSASWPETLLPPKLSNSRILTYGYDAYVVRKGVAGSNRLPHHAKNLLHDLTTNRNLNDSSSRPLIFVAHSLGGLVCKKAILLSRNNPDAYLCDIFKYTKGIIFMGTPHRGSWMADWAKIPASALGLVKSVNKPILGVLQTDNELLDSVQDDFWSMIRGLREGGRPFEVICAREELPLPVVGKVVSDGSAALEGYDSFSIHANHRDMVRFASAEENGFKSLLGVLTRWKSQLEPVVQPSPLSKSSQNCLQSLAFPQMQDRSHDIDNATAGTCEWLLRHEKYTTWTACDQGLLWIKGKPGSGKSTLLKYALSNHNSGDGALVLSFFFHGRGDELQKTPLGLIRSLLHQILGQAPDALQDLVGVFESKCKNNGSPGADWRWHEGELRPFLQASLPKVLRTRPIWLFIDALDECGKDNAVRLVGAFNALLESLATQSEDLQQFHICFSCRHYPILDADESRFEICTEHENEKDISAFVDDKLAAFRTGASSNIPDLITARASGVFMWARLVVERILDLERDGAGPLRMEKAISATPPDLDALYRQLVRDMDARSKKLIQWVCFATRPLSLDELRWAMVIEADCPYTSLQACQSAEDYVADGARMKRQAQTLSRGLVEVTHTQVVQFIHQSVKDFFFEKDFSTLGGGKTLTEAAIRAHLRFFKICLRYLAMEEIGQVEVNVKNNDGDTALSLAIGSSQEAIVRLLLGTAEVDVNVEAGDGLTPLSLAAKKGQEDIVQLLLDTGKVDINKEDDEGRTALSLAAENGHEAVVQLLKLTE